MNPHLYVAFLRGINVGGTALITMADLKRALSTLGFTNVQTLLASGNVVFEAPDKDPATLTTKIEQHLERCFHLKIAVLLRPAREIQSLIDSNPFKSIQPNPQTRLLITFLPDASVPHPKPGPSAAPFGIVRFSQREICCAFDSQENRGTPDLMKTLEKQFGKRITTRTWNTIQRLAGLFSPPESPKQKPKARPPKKA
jgi:uncharacterized protein (DUF1697 family)